MPGSQRAHQRVERHEHEADRDIEKDGTDHSMIGDLSRAKHSAGDDPDQHEADQQPAAGLQADVQREVAAAAPQERGGAQQHQRRDDADDRHDALRHDQQADNQQENNENAKRKHSDRMGGPERHNDEEIQNDPQGKRRQDAVAPSHRANLLA